MHKGTGEYIGNPVPHYRLSSAAEWDTVKLDKTAGNYMICYEHGVGIKWIDRKDGMMIVGWNCYHEQRSNGQSKVPANPFQRIPALKITISYPQ